MPDSLLNIYLAISPDMKVLECFTCNSKIRVNGFPVPVELLVADLG